MEVLAHRKLEENGGSCPRNCVFRAESGGKWRFLPKKLGFQNGKWRKVEGPAQENGVSERKLEEKRGSCRRKWGFRTESGGKKSGLAKKKWSNNRRLGKGKGDAEREGE